MNPAVIAAVAGTILNNFLDGQRQNDERRRVEQQERFQDLVNNMNLQANGIRRQLDELEDDRMEAEEARMQAALMQSMFRGRQRTIAPSQGSSRRRMEQEEQEQRERHRRDIEDRERQAKTEEEREQENEHFRRQYQLRLQELTDQQQTTKWQFMLVLLAAACIMYILFFQNSAKIQQ